MASDPEDKKATFFSISVGRCGYGKSLELAGQFPELKKVRQTPPENYRSVACCASCEHFKEHPPLQEVFLVGYAWCEKYQTTTVPSGLCEGYEAD